MQTKPSEQKREVVFIDLNVAQGRIVIPAGAYQQASLHLCTESGVDDGAYFHAESIQVYGVEQITVLRDALTQALNRVEERKKQVEGAS